MVAIVSGNGFGLTNTSGGVLGQQGLFGGALHGTGKEGAYVNVFNGNLSLQDGDGFLASSGLNLALIRTYNSQAALSDANNNGWQDALLKQVKLVGTLNATDSYVQRIDADGSMSTFKYQSANVYVSTDGAGGFQTLTYAPAVGATAAQWTWRADRTDLNGPYEVYDTAQAGYIVKAGDQSAVRLNYTYTKLSATSFQLNKVTDAAGDSMVFVYDAKANLAKVTITPSGAAAYAVSYTYDAQNRLSTVTTTQPPTLAIDALSYTTTYTYGPDVNGLPSQLIIGVVQSDGTRLDFVYDDNGRVFSYATHTGANDGVGHVTSFSYDTSGRTTSVTDPLRNVTTYGYDTAGQLTSVSVPGAGTTTYSYDAANDNVLSTTDARGLRTEYTYDGNGNRTGQRDAAGNTVTRVYVPGTGLLLSETTYLGPSDNWAPTAPQTTRYAYDQFNRLRYAVTPEGRVTEYVYPSLTAATQVEYSAVRQYTADFYAPAGTAPLDTVALDKWNGTKTAVSQTNYTYVRGRVSQAVTVNSDSATAVSTTSYTYSPNGQLLNSTDGNGNTTTLTYDGLGRQRTKVVTNKAGTVVSSASTAYAGAGAVVTDTLYNPLTKVAFATNTSTYDAAGELLSVQQSGVVGSTTYAYDAEGHVRMSTSPGGQRTYWLYDKADRQVAEIDATGVLTELVYNQGGQVIRTIRYATALTAQKIAALTTRDADGSVADAALDSFRPVTTPQDRSSWNFYDKLGRLADAVDTAGYVTHYDYDGAARLKATLRAIKVDTATLAAKTAAELQQMTAVEQSASTEDRVSRKLYDGDGLLVGQIDARGYLTEYRYNAAGLLVETISYNNRPTEAYIATGALATLRPASHAADLREYRVYDAQKRLVGTVDADGYLTELSYDTGGNVSKRTSYAAKAASPAATTLALIKASMTSTTATSAENRVLSYTYDALGRLLTTTNAFTVNGTSTNWITTNSYDANGKLLSSTQNMGGAGASAIYNGQGRLVSESSGPGAKPTTYAYDADGLLLSKTTPTGGVTLYYYDAAGRLTHTVDPLGYVTRQSYDNFGQVVSTRRYGTKLDTAGLTGGRDANLTNLLTESMTDQGTLFFYDGAGRLNYTVAADGTVEGRSYGQFGQVASTTRYGAMVDPSNVLSGNASWQKSALDIVVNRPPGGNRVSTFEYSASGQLLYTVDPAGNRQGKTYDTFGRVDSVTEYGKDAPDAVVSYAYNKRGQVVDYTDALGNHINTTYNAFGEAIRVVQRATAGSVANSALDAVTRSIYDDNGRLAASIDPLGVVTFYLYNGDGKVIDKVTYSAPLKPADLTVIDTQLLNSNNASVQIIDTVRARAVAAPLLDARQQFSYDTRGRLIASYTAKTGSAETQEWSVTTFAYDESDRVVGRTAYATPYKGLPPGGTTPPPKPTASTSDARVRMVYDAAGRLTDTLTALNTLDATGSITVAPVANGKTTWALVSQQYDAFGNITQRTAYSKALNVSTVDLASADTNAPAAADISLIKAQPAAGDAVNVYRYDSTNRVVLSATAQNTDGEKVTWGVTENIYKDGLLDTTIEYGGNLLLAVGTSPQAAPPTNLTRDRKTVYTYDLANRLKSTTDALGGVLLLDYDARGNVITRTQKSSKVGEADRVIRTEYDLNNRPTYRTDATGSVSRNIYDALGNLVTTIGYFNQVDPATLGTGKVSSLIKTSGSDRTERFIYDQAGQRRFTLDAEGYLSQQSYDALGRTLTRSTYMSPIGSLFATDSDYTVDKVTGLLGAAGIAYTTATQYDAQGNVVRVTDAKGFVESYTYDARGNKLTYTNQLKAVWTYTYDAASRLVSIKDPAIMVYPSGATRDTAGTSLALVTQLAYDGFGNMVSRTEGVGSESKRVTGYGYDLRGRQIQTVAPQIAAYDYNAAAGADGRTETAAVTHQSRVVYDVLGNAEVNADIASNQSYKVYDRLGRVIYDIDVRGYVTGYERNGFGEVKKLTRYAKPLGASDIPQLLSYHELNNGVPPSAQDRVVNTTYDAAGRVLTVSEPQVTVYDQQSGTSYLSARTTATEYNGLGQAYRQSVYGLKEDGGKTPAAVTRYYFDRRGNTTAQIQALSDDAVRSGYLTTYAYNGAGKRLNVKEYATATTWSDQGYVTPGAVAADRETSYVYDGNGLKTEETQIGALVTDAGTSNIKRLFDYDATGNQTVARIEGGTSTITYYDALGRTTAIAQVAAAGAPSTLMPAAQFRLDAYGNVVVRTDYAGGAPATLKGTIGTTVGTFTAPTTNALDRTTLTTYDIAGHAIAVTDAELNVAYSSYDVFGRLAKQWRVVSNDFGATKVVETAYQINRYDALGHLVESQKPGNVDLVDNKTANPTVQKYTLNAFGEIESLVTSNGTLIRTEKNDYDNAGRIWRNNAGDGIDKITLFDAQGNATVQLRRSQASGDNQFAALTIDKITEALDMSGVQRVDTRYNLLGYALDTDAMHGNDLYFLARLEDGSWAKRTQLQNSEVKDALLIIGDRTDRPTTDTDRGADTVKMSVLYRPVGGASWINSSERVSWVDGYPVFNTSGLAGGKYEYRILVQPQTGASYERDGGALTIRAEASDTKAQELIRLYMLILGRAPDPGGLSYWMGRINNGATLSTVAAAMLSQAPDDPLYQNISREMNNQQIIEAIYRNRYPTRNQADPAVKAEITGWIERMYLTTATISDNRGQTLADLARDPATVQALAVQVAAVFNYAIKEGGLSYDNAKAVLAASTTPGSDAIALGATMAAAELRGVRIARAYIALFGRAPDKIELDRQLTAATAADVVGALLTSDEWNAQQSYAGLSVGQLNELLINRVFTNLVGRRPTGDEFGFWSGQLNQNKLTRAQFVVNVADALASNLSDSATATQDRDYLMERVQVSMAYASMAPVSTDGATLMAINRAVLAGIGVDSGLAPLLDRVKLAVEAQRIAAAGITGAVRAGALATPMEANQLRLTQLYVAIYNRAPDVVDFRLWLNSLQNGNTLQNVADTMLRTPEGIARYPDWQSNLDFAGHVYATAFGAGIDPAALQAWGAALADQSRGTVLIKILTDTLATTDSTRKPGRDIFNGKVGVGMTYALNATGNDKTTATLVNGLVVVKDGVVDIAAAMAEVSKASVTLARDRVLATAQAASTAATLVATTLAAARNLSSANANVDTIAAIAANTPQAASVLRSAQMYVALLNRDTSKPGANDLAGLLNRARSLFDGADEGAAAQVMLDSPEGLLLYPANMSGADFVLKFYNLLSGGNSITNAADLQRWKAMASTRAQFGKTAMDILNNFVNAPKLDATAGNLETLRYRAAFDRRVGDMFTQLGSEAEQAAVVAAAALAAAQDAQAKAVSATAEASKAANAIAAASGTDQKYVTQLARLYAGVLNRGGEPNYTPIDMGFMFWLNDTKTKGDMKAIADSLLSDTEGNAMYGSLKNKEFIAKLFLQVLGREPGTDDVYWLNRLEAGKESRGTIAAEMVVAVTEHIYPRASEYDAAYFFNKKVADALETFSTAKKTIDGIAKFASDAAKATTDRNNAYNALAVATDQQTAAKNATIANYSTVTSAQQAKNYLASSYLTDLLYIRTALRMPNDYSTLVSDIDSLSRGFTTLTTIAGLAKPWVTDATAFFTALYQRILDRPADSGISYWLGRTDLVNGTQVLDPAKAVLEFVTGAKSELNGTIATYPMQKRTNFPAELANITAQNRNIASPLAASYDQAVQAATADIAKRRIDTKDAYDLALSTYNRLDDDMKTKAAWNDLAQRSVPAVKAAIGVNRLQASAATAKGDSMRADEILVTARDKLANWSTLKAIDTSGMTTAQLIAYANSVVGTSKSMQPDYNLSNAMANAADVGVAMAMANKITAAASTTTRQVLQVVQSYALLLNRAPTLAEVNLGVSALVSGQSADSYNDDLIAANPSLVPASMSNDDFVRYLYRSFRSAPPDETGLRFWSGVISGPSARTRGQLVNFLINSLYRETINPDAVSYDGKVQAYIQAIAKSSQAATANPDVAAFLSTTATVLRTQALKADAASQAALTPEARAAIRMTQLYMILMGRVPEPTALMAGIGQMTTGGITAQFIAKSMLNSLEISGRLPATLSNTAFVNAFYKLSLYRAPDSAELAGLVEQLDIGQISRAELVLNALDAVYAYTGGDLAKLEARNMVLADMGNAMNTVADTMANYGAVLNSGFGNTLGANLTTALKTYFSIGRGIDSTTTASNYRANGGDSLVVDRWGNVLSRLDARDPNWRITYTYNDNNQLILTGRTGLAQDANGQYTMQQLSTSTTYDALGNVLSTIDARGNKNSNAYDAAGNLLSETHADFVAGGAAVSVAYINDAFGQHTKVTQNAGAGRNAVVTSYAYDKLGRQSTRTAATVNTYYYNESGNTEKVGTGYAVDTYQYDALGRRVRVTTTNTSTVDPNAVGGLVVSTRYDLSGNIVATIDAAGNETRMAYDALNHKTAEQAVVVSNAPDASLVKRWQVDLNGRVERYTGVDGSVTAYDYDTSGQLRRQYTASLPAGAAAGTARQDLGYTYEDGTGRLLRIEDVTLNQVTTYTYDRAGNRLTEKVWLTLERRALQDQTLRYDGFNRLTDIVSTIPGANYQVHYTYDQQGNRTGERTAYTNDLGEDKVVVVNYGYDKMNRQNSVGGTIQTNRLPATQPDGKPYDADWIDPNASAIDSITRHTTEYDWLGNRVRDVAVGNSGTKEEKYQYDLLGRLTTITDGAGAVIGERHYDSAGRVVYSSDKPNKEARLSRYDRAGHLLHQRTTEVGSTSVNGKLKNSVTYGNYDRYNNLSDYAVTAGGQVQRTKNDYTLGRDGYQLSTTEVRNDGKSEVRSSKQFYDANGNLASVVQYKDLLVTVKGTTTYLSDSNGHILLKNQDGLRTTSLLANDELIGSSNINYESFSSVYDGVASPAATDAPGVYVVQGSTETLMSVAKALWGDQNLWYLLADANGGISSVLQAGQQLIVPHKVNTVSNTYDTFSPYNKSEAIGNTAPELAMPPPQSKGGCGVVGTLIMVVVAVAVTYITAGAASSAVFAMAGGTGSVAAAAAAGTALGTLSTVAGAAIGAAVGSIASQAVGITIGAQDGFNWKGVAMSALGGAVTAGVGGLAAGNSLGSTLNGSSWSAVAARAALSNTITQGIGNLTGLQQGFSWSSVAAAYAGAAVGNVVGGKLEKNGVFGSFTEKGTAELARATLTGFAAGLTTAVARGGKIAVAQIATDAFGNALGSSLADSINSDGRTLPRRPISDFTSITPVELPSTDADHSGLEIGGGGYSSKVGANASAGSSAMVSSQNAIKFPTDAEVLAGSITPSNWSETTIDKVNKIISVGIKVNFDTSSLSSDDALRLSSLADKGVERFWSRPVTLDGDKYDVYSYLNEDKNGMGIALKISNAQSYDDYARSSNTIGGSWYERMVVGSNIYYQPGVFKNTELTDMNFMVVGAHEIGHPLLLDAEGQDYSWGHKGTSGLYGGENGGRPAVPAQGELDLMKYYKGLDTRTEYNRTKASEQDVKNLIFKSKRN